MFDYGNGQLNWSRKNNKKQTKINWKNINLILKSNSSTGQSIVKYIKCTKQTLNCFLALFLASEYHSRCWVVTSLFLYVFICKKEAVDRPTPSSWTCDSLVEHYKTEYYKYVLTIKKLLSDAHLIKVFLSSFNFYPSVIFAIQWYPFHISIALIDLYARNRNSKTIK